MTIGDKIQAAVETIVKTNSVSALKNEFIRDVEYSVFKTVPAPMRDLLEACRETHNSHVDVCLVFQKDRWYIWIIDDPLPRSATDKLDRRGICDIRLS